MKGRKFGGYLDVRDGDEDYMAIPHVSVLLLNCQWMFAIMIISEV